jgi:hypothetical protein
MSTIISNTGATILELLARFKFLCLSQILPLIGGKSVSYTRGQLAILKNKGLIASYNLEKPIKSESMYYLTEKGKELLMSNTKIFADDIRLVLGEPFFVRDYGHRKATIQVHVSLFYHLQSLDISIVDFLCYFDKSGNNRKSGNLEARTKIAVGTTFFIPDCIMLTKSEEKTTLFLIEVFCDASTTRPIEQLFSKHIPAIAQGSPAEKFGLAANPFVLSVFESASIAQIVIEKLQKLPAFKPFAHLFFIASLEDVKNETANAWKDIDGNMLVFK